MNIFKLRKPKLFSYAELLPAQPVPELQKTISQYLDSCRPVKSTEEMKNLVKTSQEFIKSEGKRFQQELEHHSWTEDNYVSDWWTKEAYLTFRDSLLKLNFYGGGFLAPPTTHMTSRAALLVREAQNFIMKILNDKFSLF